MKSEKGEENMQSRKKSLITLAFSILMISAPLVAQQNFIAQTRSFTVTIVNNSRREIHRFHLSSKGSANWGADILGRSILYPGNSKSITVTSGEYDLLFIDASENQCVLKSFQVYNDRSWELTEDWIANNCRK
jgi:hypothetical protein